jgi:hypothetical protein
LPIIDNANGLMLEAVGLLLLDLMARCLRAQWSTAPVQPVVGSSGSRELTKHRVGDGTPLPSLSILIYALILILTEDKLIGMLLATTKNE